MIDGIPETIVDEDEECDSNIEIFKCLFLLLLERYVVFIKIVVFYFFA